MKPESEIGQLSKLLVNAERDREMYIYAVSHDLRTAVFVIDSFSKLLLDDYGNSMDQTAQQFVDNIRKSTQAMSLLIDDLLAIARLSSVEIRQESFNLSELVAKVDNIPREAGTDRPVRIDIQPDIILNSDRALLKIVIQELLDNARKATAKSALPVITVSCETRSTERIVSVRDNGLGFDMRNADKLFRALKKLHADTEFPGRGTGLAKVQRIMALLDGEIRVESKPGEGTTFQLIFPAQ